MAWAGDINDICALFFDQAVQVNVDEILARRSAPVSE